MAASTEPRDLHSTSVLTMTMTMPQLGMFGVGEVGEMTVIADTETWSDQTGRMRAESTTRYEGPAAAMMGAMRGQDAMTTLIQDGESLYQYQEALNIWWRHDIAEMEEQLAASGMPFDASNIDELYQEIFAKMAVDLITWRTLSSDISASIDVSAMAEMLIGAGGMGVGEGMEEVEGMGDMIENVLAAVPPMPFRMRMNTTTIDYEPELSDEIFTFTPPEGAVEMDFGAFATGGDMDEESLEQMMEQMQEQFQDNPSLLEMFGGTPSDTP